jgi:acyl-coenzyme A synthetase/AMP-(fatty) acid ligase
MFLPVGSCCAEFGRLSQRPTHLQRPARPVPNKEVADTLHNYADIPERFNLAAHFIDRNLEEGRGARVALWHGGRATTYAELFRLVNQAGHVLRDVGANPGDRVLLACNDNVESVALWWAAVKVGAVVADVYPFVPANDLEYYLNYSKARVIVTDASTRDKVRSVRASCPWLRRSLVIGGAGANLWEGEASFDLMAAQAPPELSPADTNKDDIALWKFTTGSTGQPKAAVHLQHDPLICFWSYAQQILHLGPDDVVLRYPSSFSATPGT